MDIKSYVSILKWAIQNQIEYVTEEGAEVCDTIEKARYYEGINMGLKIALEKIEASMFLVDR